jgi:branched-chain amino acid transport system substrate-binding protein
MRSPAFVLALVLTGSGCGKAPEDSSKSPTDGKGAGDPNVIKIVSSLPRTGSAKAQTDTIVNGIRMAFDDAGWKAGSFTIKYDDLDDATAAEGKWTAEKEAANADQAIGDPDVMVYIGTYNSGAAEVSIPKLNRHDILMISPANTWPGLTKPGKGKPGEPEKYRPSGKVNYTRVVPADDMQGPVGADWSKKLGAEKVYIIHDNEVYGKGIAELYRERAKEIGLKVLGFDGIDVNQQEFKALMVRVKETNPDLIYFGGTTQTKAGQIAKDIIAVGMNAKYMVPDGCFEDAFIKAAGAEALNNRAYVTFGGLPPEKLVGKGAAFVKAYKAKYGGEPEGYAVYGYDAAAVAIEAIKKAGKKDRNAIREACLAIKNFDGALGKWSFDKNGDTTLKTMSGQVVQDGRFQFSTILGGDGD